MFSAHSSSGSRVTTSDLVLIYLFGLGLLVWAGVGGMVASYLPPFSVARWLWMDICFIACVPPDARGRPRRCSRTDSRCPHAFPRPAPRLAADHPGAGGDLSFLCCGRWSGRHLRRSSPVRPATWPTTCSTYARRSPGSSRATRQHHLTRTTSTPEIRFGVPVRSGTAVRHLPVVHASRAPSSKRSNQVGKLSGDRPEAWRLSRDTAPGACTGGALWAQTQSPASRRRSPPVRRRRVVLPTHAAGGQQRGQDHERRPSTATEKCHTAATATATWLTNAAPQRDVFENRAVHCAMVCAAALAMDRRTHAEARRRGRQGTP
jgi:hypothetical protein